MLTSINKQLGGEPRVFVTLATERPNASAGMDMFFSHHHFNACDASGFYWTRERANAESDAGSAAGNITRVGGIINRGRATAVPLHDQERQTAFSAIWRKLNDST